MILFKDDRAQEMLTDPHNECSRAGFLSRTALQMIKYPTKYSIKKFSSAISDSITRAPEVVPMEIYMNRGESTMPQLWDEISDAQKPLSFILLNFWTLHRSSETDDMNVMNQ